MNTPLTAEQLRIQSLRDGIDSMMLECTEAQLQVLHRIHDAAPWKGLSNCPVSRLGETYELLRRTVMQNTTQGATRG